MVGRRVKLEFPMVCDRCGRVMHPGETVVQRIYPHETYITHPVCPFRGRSRDGFGPKGQSRKPENK